MGSTYYNHIANFTALLNIGSKRRYRFIKIKKLKVYLEILRIFYINGVIRTYHVREDDILVYLKYKNDQIFWRELKIISRPGKRVYWSLKSLAKNYSKHNFSGFFIISTSQGLLTSDYCLLREHISGEILIKVVI